jgi:hypothetical protein
MISPRICASTANLLDTSERGMQTKLETSKFYKTSAIIEGNRFDV